MRYRKCFDHNMQQGQDPSGAVRIREAAEELFLEKGYGAATVRDIAAKAEVTQGLVTYHFGSKEYLAREVYMQIINRIYEHIAGYLLKNRELLVAERLYVTYMTGWDMIDKNEHRARFVYELIARTDVVDAMPSFLLELVDRIVLSCHLEISRKEYQAIIAAMLGEQKMLIRLHEEAPGEFTSQDIADMVCSNLYYNLGLSDQDIAAIISKGLEYARAFPI